MGGWWGSSLFPALPGEMEFVVSIKLHNGYLINASDMMGVMGVLQSFAREVTPVFEECAAALVGSMCVNAIDALAMGMPVPWLEEDDGFRGSVALCAIMHVNRRQTKIQETMRRDPKMDFECKVTVIPTPRKVFATLYTERPEFERVWRETAGVTHYPYWDNTDGPDDMSGEEWKQRGAEWCEATGRSYIPARVGLTFEPFDSRIPILSQQEIVKSFPTFEKRCLRMAKHVVRDEWCQPRIDAIPPDERAHRFMRVLNAFADWTSTPEAKQRLTDEANRISTILKPELGVDDLATPLPQNEKKAE